MRELRSTHPRRCAPDLASLQMDLGLAPAAEEDLQVRAHKRVAVGSTTKDQEKQMILLMKLGLSNALACRVLKSVTMYTYLMEAAQPAVVAGKAATVAYAKQVEGMDAKVKARDFGQPHIHLWNALVRTASAAEGSWKAPLDAYVVELQALPSQPARVKRLMEEVRYVRISKTYLRSHIKLEASFHHGTKSEEMWTHVAAYLVQVAKAEEKQGVAPPGEMEREIQKVLDSYREAGKTE